MKYYSTRQTDKSNYVSSSEAILKGLAPDGGLYIPETIPSLSENDIVKISKMSYPEAAEFILSLFLTDYDRADIKKNCEAAYSSDNFPTDDDSVAPLVPLDEKTFVLELWHGPTSAFKDMALQIMPRLLSDALKMKGEKRKARILVATSGDTGKAALEGYKDVDGTEIMVFYPSEGVSKMQKKQMASQEGNNVKVYAIKGNFDDAQTGVKNIFSDPAAAEEAENRGFFFSSANSINWGRLAPQIVYYVYSYCTLLKQGKITYPDKINICVPTGNFGNILAAYFAKKMGLPVNRFICASNQNKVLTDFFETGIYDRNRPFFKTISPSMDILISSNLERLLCLLGGEEMTSSLMAELKETGRYEIPFEMKAELDRDFRAYYLSDDEDRMVISSALNDYGYLSDTHTAVGIGAVKKYRALTKDDTPVVIASTASPYKFSSDVLSAIGGECESSNPYDIMRALSRETGTKIPEKLLRTLTLDDRFTEVIQPCGMKDAALSEI